jgi:CBS domain-containing protein
MRAEDIMTSPVITVRTDQSVRAAATVLATHDIASAPVVDDGGRVVGMFSELDAIRGRLPHDPRNHMIPPAAPAADSNAVVGDVMTPVVVCYGPHTDIAHVASTMVEQRLRAIPIVDGTNLLGIVSRHDLVRLVARGHDDEIPATHWRPHR